MVSSETLKCSGGVTRQIHPTRRSVKLAQGKNDNMGCRWENTTVHKKVSRNHLAPKDLRWRDSRSYDVLNFPKVWGRSTGHPEEPTEI